VVRVEADTPELLAEIHAQIAEYLEAEGVRLPAA
jgi:hypothetical protein